MAADILIVDDEADIRELVSGILEDEGFGARTAGRASSFLIFGCKAAGSTGCRCWMRSRSSIRSCPSS
jgi:DNA-binding NtrC family response regulator